MVNPFLKYVFSLMLFAATSVFAIEEVDSTIVVGTDTVAFAMQVPDGYLPDSPPAIVVAWHSWGNSQYEIFNNTAFHIGSTNRGWIIASHAGPDSAHWNNRGAQRHCRIMLDWIAERYPFNRDSIYMIGGSMGGAAGQVWHVNNCGINDYLIAATAGGSQIIDCQLRAEQYLAEGDTNRSMRAHFGGIPGESDSVDFEYHRTSAVHLADTTKSLHFNSLTLPIWSQWGTSALEQLAYAEPAMEYELLRTGDPAITSFAPSGIGNHGLMIMPPNDVLDWLSQFSVNRYPDTISIAADESDDYYYTSAILGTSPYTLGRYGVVKDEAERRLDISLIRNIQVITIEFDFPWSQFDTLWGVWSNEDIAISEPHIRLRNTPRVMNVIRSDGADVSYVNLENETEIILEETGEFTVFFEPSAVNEQHAGVSQQYQLSGAYPNPFNSSTSLLIESPLQSNKQILVYDIQGRLVKQIVVQLTPGLNQLRFDGQGLSSGTYFTVLKGASMTPLKLMLLK